MAAITIKFGNLCRVGGSHGTFTITGDIAATVSASVGDVDRQMDYVAGLTNPEKFALIVAIHANANALTKAQVKAELAGASGVVMTL